ncbi:uncharacterized protein LOC127130944 [Lathyrus oleraceus]|uniref:uncharacterized protein LOC127130944 n=1 Tax=Pisum sativum TaxID=3888 RepID=UPI0021D1842A|nr:uncharacterized protein LOC127130944 [Pisum sativum]
MVTEKMVRTESPPNSFQIACASRLLCPSKSYSSEAHLHYNLKQISSSLPQPFPTYSPYEPAISIPTPSEPHNSEPNTPSSPPHKFNLEQQHSPYMKLEITDPPSLSLALLQAKTPFEQHPSVPETSVPPPSEPPSKPPTEQPSEPPTKTTHTSSEPQTKQPFEPPTETTHTSSEPINPSFEPAPPFPTLEESFALFSESSVVKLKTLSEQSSLSDNPSEVRNHWNGFLIWMTSEVFKLKGLYEQVRNDYIREAEERLEERLAKEAEEKAHQEAEEKERLEAKELERKEAKEKVTAEAAAAKAEAKAKADAEEAAHIIEEEASKEKEVSLTQCESSNSDLSPLVLKTLEELQKEQQLVRARLDQQDSINSSIQTLPAQLLQRMPPPPNP